MSASNPTPVDNPPGSQLFDPGPHALGWRGAALIVAFGASMLLIGLGGRRVLTFHEAVFAEPAKEMLAIGDWIVPRIAGVPYLDKPPGNAWAIAAAMRLFGSESEFVVRLPSVLAALVAALASALLAARWFGRTYGLLTGLLQLSSVHVLLQARLAESDTLLCAGVTIAMSVFGLAVVAGPRPRLEARWAPWLFYAALAFSALAKAGIGVAFVMLACLTYCALARDRRAVRFLIDPIGLAIFLAPTIGWLAWAMHRCPEVRDAMLLHHFGRFAGKQGHHEPALAYLYLVPMMLLPWSPLVGLGLSKVLREKGAGDPRWRFLACWFVPGMCLLAFSAYKSRHYPIPLLTPLTILATIGLVQYLTLRYRARRPRLGMLAVLTVSAAIAAVVMIEQTRIQFHDAVAGLVAMIAVGLLIAIYCEARKRVVWQIGAMLATVWCVGVGVQLWLIPGHDSYRHQAELAARINRAMPPGKTLYMLNLPENQITYYLQPPLRRIDTPSYFTEEVERQPHNEYFVLAPIHVAEMLHQRGEAHVLRVATEINSRYMTERDRLTFFVWKPAALAAQSSQPVAR
ncbi:MAG TPA: glycosyltransferase family 39 protein [Pirellulales bacterium]